MERWVLSHQFIDETTGIVEFSNSTTFNEDCLYEGWTDGGIGILSRLSTFLKGSGFEITGSLEFVDRKGVQ